MTRASFKQEHYNQLYHHTY